MSYLLNLLTDRHYKYDSGLDLITMYFSVPELNLSIESVTQLAGIVLFFFFCFFFVKRAVTQEWKRRLNYNRRVAMEASKQVITRLMLVNLIQNQITDNKKKRHRCDDISLLTLRGQSCHAEQPL